MHGRGHGLERWLAVPWVRWTLAATVLAVGGASFALLAPDVGAVRAFIENLPTLALVVAGLIAWDARPGSRTGFLLVLTGLLFPMSLGSSQARSPAFYAVGVICFNLWAIPGMIAFVAFPSGRIHDRAERAGLIAWALYCSVGTAVLVFVPIKGCARCPAGLSPFVQSWASWVPVLYYAQALVLVAWVGRVAVNRWRRASAPGRRVLAPVAITFFAVAVATFVVNVLWASLGLSGPEQFAPDTPAGVQAADVITNIVWATAPFSFVVGLLRTRLTRSTMGELVVALGHASEPARLQELVARALGDPSLELGFATEDGFVDAEGRRLAVPDGRGAYVVEGDTGPLAVFVHDPALEYDDGLLPAVAGAARLALENARLQALVRVQLAEVRASRARIIEAGDRERRRIERNLHDGAQQRLVGLALLLRMTEREVNGDKSAHTHVTRALDEAQAALQDLRDLATGLHPRVLARHGLAAALASLADRSDVPVSVDADLNGRLPEAVEACAYFISSEALQNVSKHAGATRVWVHARRLNGELAIEIGDDGVGGARLEEGGGLQGLRDRVEAIGGALTLESPVGAGTVVRAVLPV